MLLFDLREPMSAVSHGAAMLLAIPVTWLFWNQAFALNIDDQPSSWLRASRFQRGKAACLLIFGASLTFCYGVSAAFHGARLDAATLSMLHRLDHVGIYLLIAGSYTPVAWSLMSTAWACGTLFTVWTIAISCALRVWCGGVMPIWVSTSVYLTLGWGALICYFKLAQTFSHRTLIPLPLGGVFYTTGAVINLLRWPVFVPGFFAAHELFHLFVVAGSACHIYFMFDVVIPSSALAASASNAASSERWLRPTLDHALVRGSKWWRHSPANQRPVLSTMLTMDAPARPAGDRSAANTESVAKP